MPITTLYVESQETDDSRIWQHLNSNEAYAIDRVYSLSEAVRAIENHAYDVILLNLNLSDSNGIATITALKSFCDQCIIIALSGNYDNLAEYTQECIDAGAQDLVSLKHPSTFYLHKVIKLNIEFRTKESKIEEANSKVERNNKRISLLNEIYSYPSKSEQDLLDYSLNQAIELTQSEFGYIYFYNEESKLFTLNSWSNGVMKDCEVVEPQTCYELDKTGYWGEAVRQRKALIMNDFHAHNPLKKGYPEGHVPLTRFMTTPIFDNEKIIAVVGMANKVDEYNQEDVDQLQLMLNSVWHLTAKNRSETKNKELFAAMQHSPVSIVITDPMGNIELANDYFEKVTGYSFEEVKGKNPRVLKSGAQSQEFYKDLWDTISSGETWIGELQNRKKTGELYWESATISPILNPNGVITKYVAVKKDITQEKRSAEIIHKSQEQLDYALKATQAGTWDYNIPSGAFIINDRWAQMLGYSLEELTPTVVDTWMKLLHPDDLDHAQNLIQKHIDGEIDYYDCKVRMKHKNGGWVWIWTRGQVAERNEDGSAIRMVGTHIDVTHWKHAEEAVQQSEEKYRFLNESIREMIWSADGERNIDYINTYGLELIGKSFKELRDFGWLSIVHPDDKEHVVEKWTNAALTASAYHNEQRFQTNDGSYRWFKVSASPQKNKADEVVKWIGLSIDINAEKEALEQLVESESRFRNAIEDAPVPMLIHSNGDVVQVNKNWLDKTGYKREEISSIKEWSRLAYGEAQIPSEEFIHNLYNLTQPNADGIWNVQTKKGGKLNWDFYSSPIASSTVLSVAVDVTEKVEADKEIKNKSDQLAFLAQAGSELLEISSSGELYQYIAEKLEALYQGNAIIVVSEYSEDEINFELKSIQGIDAWMPQLQKITNYDFTGLKGPIVLPILEKLRSGKLIELDTSIYEITNKSLPKLVADAIDHILPEFILKGIGLVEKGRVFASVNVVVTEKNDVIDEALIESFCHEASAAIAKIQESEKVRESEERFKGVVSSFEDIVFTLDEKGRHNGIYGSWIDHSPLSAADFLGKTSEDLFGKEMGEVHMNAIRKGLKGEYVTYTWELEVEDKIRHHKTTLTPLFNSDNKITGLLGVGRDITDQVIHEKNIKENAAKTQLLANYATELIHFTEKKSIYEFIAKETAGIAGNSAIIIVSEINDRKTEFEIKAAEGLSRFSKTALKMVGAKLVGMKGPVSPKMIELLSDKDMADLPLDLAQIADSNFEKQVSNRLLKLIGISSIKSIKLRDDERDIATVTIATTDPSPNLDLELLRAFLNQATLAISRVHVIEGIINNEKALREAQSIAKLGSWSFNREDDFYIFSDEARRIMNLSSDERISGAELMDLVHPEDRQLMADKHKELEKGNDIEFEHRLQIKNKTVWISAISKPYFDAKGDLVRAEGTILDITSRKEAELQIAKNDARFKNLIDNSSDVIAVENKDFQVTYVSPSIEQMLGYTHEDVMQTSGRLYVHPDDRAYRDEQVALLKNGDKSLIQLKQRLRKKDKSYIWTLVTFSNQLHVPGIEGFVLNIKDIDKDERNTRELAESHQRFAMAAAATSDVIWDYDLVSNLIKGSDMFAQEYGYDITEMAGTEWNAYAHEEDQETLNTSLQEALENKNIDTWKHQYRFKKANGDYAWVMNNATILRDKDGVAYRLIGAMSNVTESRMYQKSIEIQNEKLKDIAWMQSHLVRAPLSNLLALVDLLKSDPKIDKSEIEDMIFKSASELDGVIRNIVKNAERLEGLDSSTISKGNLSLEQSIEHIYLHPSLLDMSTRSYSLINIEGRIVYINNAFTLLTGFSFDDTKLKNQLDLLFKANENELPRLKKKQANREPFESELILKTKQGKQKWVRINAQPFISKEGVYSGYLFMLGDISAEKIAEQTILEKSEILAHINDELKHFTYTVSHDLKEPINSLSSLVYLLEESAETRLNEEEREYLKLAKQSTGRISSMVKALLEYSKSGIETEKTEEISVLHVIDEVKSALQIQIQKNKAQINFHGEDKVIKAHPVQFSRVVQNLINNSIKFKSDKDPIIDITLSEDDLHWALECKDNGQGISKEDLPHVFDLFYFKNKSTYESHGIGLAVVKRLIEQHEGTIQVESEIGKGTTFNITISKFIK